jgi:hypothetical protein
MTEVRHRCSSVMMVAGLRPVTTTLPEPDPDVLGEDMEGTGRKRRGSALAVSS